MLRGDIFFSEERGRPQTPIVQVKKSPRFIRAVNIQQALAERIWTVKCKPRTSFVPPCSAGNVTCGGWFYTASFL